MRSSINTEEIIYKQLRKYLPRSFGGESYAAEMVNKLYNKCIEINPEIYFNALDDAQSGIASYDERILGESLSGAIRVKFSSESELDEFFSLFKETQSPTEKFKFESFCQSYGLNPDDIILFPISGVSMIGANISDGDTAIVDTSRIPKNGEIGAVSVNKKYFIKRIGGTGGKLILISENKDYQPYTIGPADDFKFIGVVTSIIKQIVAV